MNWKTSWGYEAIDYGKNIGRVKDTVCRLHVKNNLRGNYVRIRFSNRFGNTALRFPMVRILNGSRETVVTYQERKEINIYPGEEFYSDAVQLLVTAGQEITIAFYIGEETEIGSVCTTFSARGWFSDYRKAHAGEDGKIGLEIEEIFPFVKEEELKPNIIFGVTEVQVLSENDAGEVLLFGDSLTHMSYYPDALAGLLFHRYPGQISVINAGICGNRVLRDAMYIKRFTGKGREMGRSGMKRVRGRTGSTVDTAVILEGINDILQPYGENKMEEAVTPAELTGGLSQMIRLMKRIAKQVYIGTLMPFQSEGTVWPAKCERIRQECNQWIREQRIADGYVDFDRAIADKDNPCYIADGFHLGDGVHPNEKGAMLMAEEVMNQCFNERII